MSAFIHDLGKKAKDKVTGFTGIITSRAEYLTGCNQYGLNPGLDKEGKLKDTAWFDEARLEIVGVGIKPESVKPKPGGGPNRDCPGRQG